MRYPKAKVVPLTDEQRKLVEENHNLIYKILHKYHFDIDEWYDIAAIGLCQAAQCYDPDAGFKFSTYACKSIYNVICKQLSLDNVQHRTPPGGGLLYLEQEYGEYDEVDRTRLIDLVYENDDAFINDIIAVNDFKKGLKKLSPRDQQVILMLADGYTYQAVGDEFGLSRERVRQIILKYARFMHYKKDEKRKYNRSVK